MNELKVDITQLIERCEEALLRGEKTLVIYRDRENLKNNVLPAEIQPVRVNIYALWGRVNADAPWQLMYIGQRQLVSGWARVKQHLFHKHADTQSKIDQVRGWLKKNGEIAVSAILVAPDSMRLAIEEELIKRNSVDPTQLTWNKKGKGKKKNAAPAVVL
ncbi:hypothetical protein [Herbaspirillum huttiense]|uniref:hypothetical protein n=1 Tax=Herbaspirillum huttiense TaxID=863372 RepID=UPI002176B0C0|nr:hypothetical protein [Herbaspirillum huttiense]UWE16089.1 hypothetical protein NY669_23900 [Herbaspirillum huttiense]